MIILVPSRVQKRPLQPLFKYVQYNHFAWVVELCATGGLTKRSSTRACCGSWIRGASRGKRYLRNPTFKDGFGRDAGTRFTISVLESCESRNSRRAYRGFNIAAGPFTPASKQFLTRGTTEKTTARISKNEVPHISPSG
jgi:hypothetical protein